MSDASNLSKLVPGFDFLQGLVKNAGSALPGIGQWVAPTLNPEEIEKRIEELRTVQFWLEQNARVLGATIQALEVQRMTLSTLKTMNVQMGDLRDAMQIRMPPAAEPAEPPAVAPPPPPAPPQATGALPGGHAAKGTAKAGEAPAGLVDPMQWWGALTKQFTQLAASAVKEGAAGVAAAAGQHVDAAALKKVSKAAAKKAPAKSARKKAPARKRSAPRGGVA